MSESLRPSMKESPERGREVTIDLKFQRHGLRDGLFLTDEGREVTKNLAEQSGQHVGEGPKDFDAAKAIGSPVGTPARTPENPSPQGRALETAVITATVVAGDRAGEWNPRAEKRLSYETLERIVKAPYDHLAVYDKALAEAIARLGKAGVELKELSKDEKIKVTGEAQIEVIRHIESLHTPEAEKWRQGTAGMLADLVEHYIQMSGYLKNKSSVLYPAGTHGGTMEWLLQQALVRDSNNPERVGLRSLDEIGGSFDSSDSYDVHIKTNKDGQLEQMTVKFDNPNRPQGEMYLHPGKLRELAEFYRKLLADDKKTAQG